MSDAHRDDEILAAEYALGLLEGEALLSARSREVSDPDFAVQVSRWQDRLAPLTDEVKPRPPREALWARIAQEIDALSPSGEVINLRRSLRRWQWASGLSAAAAVVLAVLAFPLADGAPDPPADVVQAPALSQPPLAANMPIEGTPLRLDLTYLPDAQSLLVTAVGLSADGVHDHEIWLVPPKGELISLGVVKPGVMQAHSVPVGAARLLANGTHVLLTREPLGGKPAGAPTGPVVAEGNFSTI